MERVKKVRTEWTEEVRGGDRRRAGETETEELNFKCHAHHRSAGSSPCQRRSVKVRAVIAQEAAGNCRQSEVAACKEVFSQGNKYNSAPQEETCAMRNL